MSGPDSPLDEAVEVMDRLWRVGAWESQQTHESLRGYLLEETYELLDVIGTRPVDDDHLREELGDLLLQVLFHARIAQARGAFSIADVAAGLVAKLRHRSPHLDGDTAVTVAEQERQWELRKAAEKSRASVLDGIAADLPALALAAKVVERVERSGYPADRIPAELRSVQVGPDAELRLRAAVLDFAAQFRATEAAS